MSLCFDSKKSTIAGNCDPSKEYTYACRTYCEEEPTATTDGNEETTEDGGGGSGGDCSELDGFTAVPGEDWCFQYGNHLSN